jgi:hypothetical protein
VGPNTRSARRARLVVEMALPRMISSKITRKEGGNWLWEMGSCAHHSRRQVVRFRKKFDPGYKEDWHWDTKDTRGHKGHNNATDCDMLPWRDHEQLFVANKLRIPNLFNSTQATRYPDSVPIAGNLMRPLWSLVKFNFVFPNDSMPMQAGEICDNTANQCLAMEPNGTFADVIWSSCLSLPLS